MNLTLTSQLFLRNPLTSWSDICNYREYLIKVCLHLCKTNNKLNIKSMETQSLIVLLKKLEYAMKFFKVIATLLVSASLLSACGEKDEDTAHDHDEDHEEEEAEE